MLKGFRRALSGIPRPRSGGRREALRAVARGNQLLGRGDLEGARKAFEAAVATDPDYAPAWNNKGAALLRRGRVDEALASLREAVHFDPDFFDAHVNSVFAWQRKGKHGEAVIAADRALRLQEAPWLWYLKGLGHLALLESSVAARCFERALEMDPDLKEAKQALRKARDLRRHVDLYRGVYECFGTFAEDDPGCAECEIQSRCREVTR